MSEEKSNRKRSSFWIATTIILFIILLGSFLLNLLLGAAVVAMAGSQVADYQPKFQKRTITGKGESEILVIHLQGIISEESYYGSGSVKPETIKAKLEQAARDDKVKAVILQIDSPGGAITATDKIYHYLRQFRQESDKPIVAYLDTVAASGGYYAALAADQIIAHPTCITGSIGVIMSFFQMKELLENKLGIKHIVIKSARHKDIGSISREISEEEFKILNNVIQEMYRRFLEVVKQGRPNLKVQEAELLKIADGRIYTGKQAMHLGLIDDIGYRQKAVDKACELARLVKGNYKLVQYQMPRSLFQELINPRIANRTSPQLMFDTLVQQYASPRFYYLWLAK